MVDPTGLHGCGWTDPFGCVANAADTVGGAVNSAASAAGNAVSTAASWTYNNVIDPAYQDVLLPVGRGFRTAGLFVYHHPVAVGLIAGGALLLGGGGVFAVFAGGELFDTVAAADAAGEYLDAAELSLKAPLLLVGASGTAIAGGGLIGTGSYLLATDASCK